MGLRTLEWPLRIGLVSTNVFNIMQILYRPACLLFPMNGEWKQNYQGMPYGQCLLWQKQYDVYERPAVGILTSSLCPSHQTLLIWHSSICVDFKCISLLKFSFPFPQSLNSSCTFVFVHPSLVSPFISLSSWSPLVTPATASHRPPHNETWRLSIFWHLTVSPFVTLQWCSIC